MGEFVAVSVLTVLFCLGISGVEPLKNVEIIVPPAVGFNEQVTLQCLYELEKDESLYTVKWYLDGDEFYRYVPKEVPPIQTFPISGLTIDISKSDARKVELISVSHEQTGRYRCEVSADAPEFDTDVVSSQMTVVEFPNNVPLIQVGKQRYEVGERIRANCSFGPSKPAANVTWLINNSPVQNRYTSEYPVFEENRLSWVKSGLEIDTDANSFRGGRLKLKCIASVYSRYHRSSEVQIEEEKPRSASVMGPKDSSGNQVGLNSPGHGKSSSVTKSSSSTFTSKASVQFMLFVASLSLSLHFTSTSVTRWR